MKKLNRILLVAVLFFGSLTLLSLRFNATIGIMMDGKRTYTGPITFNYRAEAGGRTLLDRRTESDTLSIVTDTLYSDIMRSKGYNAVQFRIDSTRNPVRAIVKIQTALQGGVIPSAVPESDFKDAYWVPYDSLDTMIDCLVQSEPDSFTSGGTTPVVRLPFIDQLFRVVVIPLAANDSVFTFSGKILMKEK